LSYRRLFETAHDGILLIDGESGLVMDANPAVVAMLGHEREDLLGRALHDLPLCPYRRQPHHHR
jgi:PAS domain S-box-containing protein